MAVMTELTTSAAEALRSAVRGRGVQCFGGAAVFPGVAVQTRSTMPEVADASLDFVVAGPDWWNLPDALEWPREWRRCLRQDGQVQIVVEGEPNAVAALVRLLAWEAGLDLESPRRLDEASKYIGLEQLCVSPQCGFSSTLEGNEVTVEHQKAKLALCVELAHEIWGGL